MLEIRNLTYRVGTSELLTDVSWKCEPGKVSMIVGSNGAGKSTLIRNISGALKPRLGNVLWDGELLSFHINTELDRAVLTQDHQIAFPMSVSEVVMMGRYPHFKSAPSSMDHGVVAEAIDVFDLQNFEHRNVQTLSGGERQRVHFARVWAQMMGVQTSRNKVLLLDEPTTYLDLKYQWKYLKILADETSNRGWITIGVLHDLDLVLQFSDEVLLLNKGLEFASGTPLDVLSRDNIRACYGVESTIANGRFFVNGELSSSIK